MGEIIRMPNVQHNRHLGRSSNGVTVEPEIAHRALLQRSRVSNRRLARSHYENFLVTSFLLPRHLHQPFYDIYAFCRVADDLADDSPTKEQALAGLGSMERDLKAVFTSGDHDVEPERFLFIGLRDTIRRYELDQQPFFDLLAAFKMDQKRSSYETEDELLSYCKFSANPVGRLLLQLAGVNSQLAKKLSDSICTGLQLVNFLQDIRSDFRRGRIYLPQDELSQYSVDLSDLTCQANQKALACLVRSRCESARSYFDAGFGLIDEVPPWFARTVTLFIAGGLEVLRVIEKNDYDVWTSKARVSKLRQFWFLTRATLNFF